MVRTAFGLTEAALEAPGFAALSPSPAGFFPAHDPMPGHMAGAAAFDFHSSDVHADTLATSYAPAAIARQKTASAKLSKTDEQFLQIAKKLYFDEVDGGSADEELTAIAERVSNYQGREVPISYLESGLLKALGDNVDLTYMAALIGDTQFTASRPTLMKAILTKAEKPATDGVVAAAALSGVISQELAAESMTQAAARGEIAKAAKTAGGKIDAWLLDALDGIGGYSGIVRGLEPYVETTYFAIANVMGGRVDPGDVAKWVAADVRAGKMSDSAALAYVNKYAKFAMLNKGYKESDGFLSDNFQQADGVNDTDRAGLMLVQIVDDLSGAKGNALEKTIVKSDADTYLTGLGLDAALEGGRVVAKNLLKAEHVLMQTAMPQMQAASNNNDSNPLMMSTAQSLIKKEFSQYFGGVHTVGAAISFDMAGGFLGKASIGVLSSLDLQGKGSMDILVKLGDKLLENADFFPDNPLGAVGSIAAVAKVVLDNFGVGKLLGPFNGEVSGVVNLVSDASNAIDKELNDVATAVVTPAVIVGSSALFHVADNLANFGEDLFTGALSDAKGALEQLGTQLGQDLKNAGSALVSALKSAADDIVSAIASLEDDIGNLIEQLPAFAEKVGEGLLEFASYFL